MSPLGNPKYCPKRKSCRIGNALRGSPLLQGFPSFPHSPPDCGENSPLAERTASSASRKCVSFFGIPDLEGFSSCEKAYESVPCANKGLCPFETCKPLKRLDLNFLTSHSGRFFTHAGVLAVFKPRRGRLKIPVAPTGKLKLHVFPLRRAKENKHFGRFFKVRKVEYNRKNPVQELRDV